MPKRRSYNLKQFQGASSSSKPAGGKSEAGDSSSVKQRIEDSRKLQGRDAFLKKQEFAELSSNHISVPPTVGNLIGLPVGQPPQRVNGPRSTTRPRVPGPAAPESWSRRSSLNTLLSIRARRRSNPAVFAKRSRPDALLRFESLTGLEPKASQGFPALLHLALKAAAQHWDLFDRDDLPALVELPIRLRLRLLSYLGYFGPTIDIVTFEALTKSDEPVRCLDLGGLVGHGALTLPRLTKTLKAAKSDAAASSNVQHIADSWDSEDAMVPILGPSPNVSHFDQLTHLCLSHPPPSILWKDLLSLSKQVPKLTHLSLAYWARPTLTPNLATTTVTSAHLPEMSAGGSHLYSGIDRDYSEPASLLRQLSGNLLRLKWLDLEGCGDWMPALGELGELGSENTARPEDNFGASVTKTTVSMIFVDHWKNLEYLNCAQGWSPSATGVDALPKQTICPTHKSIVNAFLKSAKTIGATIGEDDVHSTARKQAEVWILEEAPCVAAGARINACRRMHACKPVEIDHGWTKRLI
ncbi:uncharacterized protein K489DRAFT_380766 [Dissoconium aciculare CBS 342.82]|uniref:Uncharacterized protein n=1 Tax=Dissoconium aciculare CBS 342.82 TaxID=1314786 RepID=A0A6J3M1Y3_9PEZI|nr:uncharacterized protein K489DRAFT_380766 [Dissoconium aciculare CBS 342.82]KAF1822030.1 hypothetical protein K489DRAFT_380766 [Dissoconium aciculare CBS 342.82]